MKRKKSTKAKVIDPTTIKNPRKAARIAAGYTSLEQVAKATRLKLSTVQRMESSGDCCYETAMMFSHLYNCDPLIFA